MSAIAQYFILDNTNSKMGTCSVCKAVLKDMQAINLLLMVPSVSCQGIIYS